MNGSFNKSESFVAGYPSGSSPGQEIPIKISLPYPYFKLSFQPGRNDKFSLSYNYSDRRNNHRNATKFTTESVTVTQVTPTHVLNAQWTKFFNNSFFMNLRFGMVLFTMNLHAKGDNPNVTDAVTSISSGNYWRNKDDYTRNRFQINADATKFIDNLAGTHELKFGGEAQLAFTTWYVYGVTDPLTGGCSIRKYGANYDRVLTLVNNGFDRRDNVVDLHGFVQDNWAVTRKLNLSLGVRVEYNSVVYPKQNTSEGPISFQGKVYDRSIPNTLKMFKWLNAAPRVGLIYDLFADGKTLFKVSWSRYILPNQTGWINLSHPNGWFGYYQYLTAAGTPIPGYTTPWAMPGGFKNGGAQIGYKDWDLKAGYTDEFTVGIEKEFWRDWSIGARYIRKWDRNQPNLVDAAQLDIDKLLTTGELDWSKNWVQVTGTDPFDNQPVTYWKKTNLMANQQYIVNPPGADRDYDGVEFTLNKRFSRRWALNISYVYAKSRGLITTARADESLGGGSGGFFQDPNAHTNALGTLPLERRHQIKMEGLIKGPWGINLSGYFRYLKGLPWTRVIQARLVGVTLPQGSYTIYAEKRGSRNLPDFKQLDLRLEKTLRLKVLTLGVFADCFNVFNMGVATAVWNDSSSKATPFGQMTAINDPRIFQLGARFEF